MNIATVRGLAAAGMFATLTGHSAAAPAHWTTWTSASYGETTGSAAGYLLTTAGSVQVEYAGEVFYSTDLAGVSNYWLPPSTYMSPEVDTPPTSGGRIDMTGGTGNVNRIVFSSPVTNPIMAIVSLGQYGVPAAFVFDVPFTLLNQGPGLFGGDAQSLSQPNENTLYGIEGNGIIQFTGSYSSLSWTNPLHEEGYGITVGAVVPEPSRSATLLLGLMVMAWGIKSRQSQFRRQNTA